MKRLVDKVDEIILDELTVNSWLAHNDIALKVTTSRNPVRLRVERLERDGYIKGYTILRGDPAHNDISISPSFLFTVKIACEVSRLFER